MITLHRRGSRARGWHTTQSCGHGGPPMARPQALDPARGGVGSVDADGRQPLPKQLHLCLPAFMGPALPSAHLLLRRRGRGAWRPTTCGAPPAGGSGAAAGTPRHRAALGSMAAAAAATLSGFVRHRVRRVSWWQVGVRTQAPAPAFPTDTILAYKCTVTALGPLRHYNA